jgi:transposase
MAKSDLQTRPIFHKTRDSIEAHLTVCFAALAICRYIQERTKLSIKKFVQRLKELRTGIVQIGDKQYTAEPVIDSPDFPAFLIFRKNHSQRGRKSGHQKEYLIE